MRCYVDLLRVYVTRCCVLFTLLLLPGYVTVALLLFVWIVTFVVTFTLRTVCYPTHPGLPLPRFTVRGYYTHVWLLRSVDLFTRFVAFVLTATLRLHCSSLPHPLPDLVDWLPRFRLRYRCWFGWFVYVAVYALLLLRLRCAFAVYARSCCTVWLRLVCGYRLLPRLRFAVCGWTLPRVDYRFYGYLVGYVWFTARLRLPLHYGC